MPFQKGHKLAGSRKGKPNKATADTRAAIAHIIDGNAHKVQGWLDRTARKKPDRALDLYLKLCEFGIPKLGRIEHTGPGGGPLTLKLTSFDDGRVLSTRQLAAT